MRIPLPQPHPSSMRHHRPRRLQNPYNPHRGVGQTKTKLELFTLYECTMPSVLRPVDPSRFCVRLITRNMRRQQYSFFSHAINICACLYSVREPQTKRDTIPLKPGLQKSLSFNNVYSPSFLSMYNCVHCPICADQAGNYTAQTWVSKSQHR